MDLNEFTLKSRSEIEALRTQIGAERFDAFKNATYNTLRNLKLGELYMIEEKISKTNIPVFVKVACLYIQETGWNCNIAIVGAHSNIVKGVQTATDHIAELSEYRRKRSERRALA